MNQSCSNCGSVIIVGKDCNQWRCKENLSLDAKVRLKMLGKMKLKKTDYEFCKNVLKKKDAVCTQWVKGNTQTDTL